MVINFRVMLNSPHYKDVRVKLSVVRVKMYRVITIYHPTTYVHNVRWRCNWTL
jgi:hypothetical protein